jgi:hypothetical protein
MEKVLPCVVECKSTYPFFEKIAAFNVRVAAQWYADQCAETNSAFQYRVTGPEEEA